MSQFEKKLKAHKYICIIYILNVVMIVKHVFLE